MRHLLVDGELFLGGGLEVAGAATVGAPLVVRVLGDNSIEFQHTFQKGFTALWSTLDPGAGFMFSFLFRLTGCSRTVLEIWT